MTSPPPATAAPTPAASWRLILTLAVRDLAGGPAAARGLAGFRLFLTCLVLGVAALATIGSLAAGFRAGLRQEATSLLGGDVALRLLQTPASPEHEAFLRETSAALVLVAELRAQVRRSGNPGMAQAGTEAGTEAGTGTTALVEIKAVSPPSYPLYGRVETTPAAPLEALLAQQDGRWGAVAAGELFSRLDLAPGATLQVGDLAVTLRAQLQREPDPMGTGALALGPRLLLASAALAETGLLQPGSLVAWEYRVRLRPGERAADWLAQLKARFPDAGWQIRDASNATPQITRFIERMHLFLSLIGLATLLIAGLGIAATVQAHVTSRITTLAVIRSLGAEGRFVFAVALIQVLLLGCAGILIGLGLGAAVPFALQGLVGAVAPIPLAPGPHPAPLAFAAAAGLLTTLAFSLWPLGRLLTLPTAILFRAAALPHLPAPPRACRLAAGLAGAGLAGLAVAGAGAPRLATAFLVATVAAAAVFALLAAGVQRLAATIRPRNPQLRLALTALSRPGNLTRSTLLSLGLGLTVLSAVALVEANFRWQIGTRMAQSAPAFFILDLQPRQREAVAAAIAAIPGTGDFQALPSLRGRIVAVNDQPAETALVDPAYGWVLRGDRGLTWAAEPPANPGIIAGRWWPADTAGPPQLAVAADVTRAFGIGVGDTLTLQVLGREVRATLAAVREIDFTTLQINFALTLSPGVLDKAPHTLIATVVADPAAEATLARTLPHRFPNLSLVPVREVLTRVVGVVEQIGLAVRLMAAVTVGIGLLVLAGGIAASREARRQEMVILKVLGADTSLLLGLYALEYTLLGLAVLLPAGLFGSLAAWAIQTEVLHWPWRMPFAVLGLLLLLGLAGLVGLGLLGAWRLLRHPAAVALRNAE